VTRLVLLMAVVMTGARLSAQVPEALTCAQPRPAAPLGVTASDPTDAPDIFTALREQLGLQLRPDKVTAAVFVIDSIERPSEN